MSSLPAHVRPLLEPALDPREALTWDDVEDRLLNRKAQLWLGDGCAMVTEIYGDTIHVWLGGGTLRGLLELRPKVEAWARAVGCVAATIETRPGWSRVLRRFGFERRGDELEKTL